MGHSMQSGKVASGCATSPYVYGGLKFLCLHPRNQVMPNPVTGPEIGDAYSCLWSDQPILPLCQLLLTTSSGSLTGSMLPSMHLLEFCCKIPKLNVATSQVNLQCLIDTCAVTRCSVCQMSVDTLQLCITQKDLWPM